MTSPYIVRLTGAGDLPSLVRMSAEIRFAIELERLLGGAEGVVRAFGEHVPAVRRTLWDEACALASAAAMRGLAAQLARFEIAWAPLSSASLPNAPISSQIGL